MAIKNSHLTIRKDLIEDGFSVPVSLLLVDGYDSIHIEDTPFLDITCKYTFDGEVDAEGSNILVKITDSTQFDPQGEPIKDRLAFAISADYDWN